MHDSRREGATTESPVDGMKQRRAIIVGEAAGPLEQVGSALSRAGFAQAESVPRLDQGLARLRGAPADLLILSIQGLDPIRLATLEREIRSRPEVSVIGTAPSADPELILRAMRAGVHEFLVYPPTPEELGNALERLFRRNGGGAASGQLLAVYTAKGGLGATSIAVNVAQACAARERGTRVALVDCVFTGGDVRLFLDLRPMYDVEHLITKLDDVDRSMLDSLLTRGPAGVSVLPASEDALFSESVDAATAVAILERLREHFDVVVADCEHHLSERSLAILDSADRILLVTQANVPALRSAQRTLALFGRLGYPDSKTCVVVNRFQTGDAFTLATVSESVEHEVFASLPNDYKTSVASLNRGVCVGQQDASSKLARAYVELAAKLQQSTRRDPISAQRRDDRPGILSLFGRNGGRPRVA